MKIIKTKIEAKTRKLNTPLDLSIITESIDDGYDYYDEYVERELAEILAENIGILSMTGSTVSKQKNKPFSKPNKKRKNARNNF